MYRVIGTDGVEYGPVSADQIKQWVAQGRANARTQVRLEDQPTWRPLDSYPELAPALGPPVATPAAAVPGAIPNYMVHSVLATLLCCIPTGIAAIVYASQVDGKVARGDLAGAVASSNNAKLWSWISFGLGIAAFLFGVMAAVIAESSR